MDIYFGKYQRAVAFQGVHFTVRTKVAVYLFKERLNMFKVEESCFLSQNFTDYWPSGIFLTTLQTLVKTDHFSHQSLVKESVLNPFRISINVGMVVLIHTIYFVQKLQTRGKGTYLINIFEIISNKLTCNCVFCLKLSYLNRKAHFLHFCLTLS